MKLIHKKVMVLLTSMIICVFMTSCNSNEYDPHSTGVKAYGIEQENTTDMLETVIKYFDNKDKEALKGLFAPAISENFNLDSQIDKVFGLYDSKSVSYEMGICEERSSSQRNNRFEYLVFCGELENIQLDNGKTFSIYISRCVVDDENPDNIGLKTIHLRDINGKNLAPIGKFSSSQEFYG